SLTAELQTRGTRQQRAPAQAAAAEALGGTLVSAAGWNRSTVSITVTTPRLDAALALVAEAAIRPAFARAELDRLRSETLDAMKVGYTQPGTVAALAANRMLFGDGAYGHPVAGTPLSLPGISVRQVEQLHRLVYRPDNAVLVLTGDVDLAQGKQLASEHFGRWKAPAAKLPAARSTAGAPAAMPLQFVKMGDTGQAGVVMVLPVPAAASADEAAGQVTNAVLGGGYSSRLSQEIRVERGLSYDASSNFDARPQVGVLDLAVQTKNASAAEVVSLLNSTLDGLSNAAVPDAELAARKAALIGGFSRSVETTQGLTAQITKLLVEGQPVALLTTRIESWSAVGADAVQAYAKAHFGAANRHTAVAGSLAQFAPGFAALHKPGDAAPLTLDPAALEQPPQAAPK
ncbi:MAG: insulinase family protein, partial [Pseudomonadota bacterium]|nr:insulinase family protein [Pseudomonadota bacterium]